MRICGANTRILRAMPQPDINAMSIGRLAPASTHQRIPQTAENRTLCRARALSKREAFVASGRGRRQAAEAGADLRSKYADSPRNVPAQNRCAADGISAGCAPRRQTPFIRGESNSAQGASVKKTLRQRRVGRAFLTAVQAESASRNPASNWDALSAPSPQLQNLRALHSKTG